MTPWKCSPARSSAFVGGRGLSPVGWGGEGRRKGERRGQGRQVNAGGGETRREEEKAGEAEGQSSLAGALRFVITSGWYSK